MHNKLTHLFQKKNKNVLNVYCTAGYPKKNSTVAVMQALQSAGVDIIEIGIPYSDPIADGPTIQNSNAIAIHNGMCIPLLFTQLKQAKKSVQVPIVLMGYLNPVLQYGIQKFCKMAASVGVAGIILPDLPMYEYEHLYKKNFTDNNLSFIFLITPQTSIQRIKLADKLSTGFVYAVSSNAITGSNVKPIDQNKYFKKIAGLKLQNPFLIGFGINNKKTFANACNYATGAIVGSAYITALAASTDIFKSTINFVKTLK